MTPDEAQSLLMAQADGGPAKAADDSLVLVPLVFNPSDNLYSPEGFNALVDSLMDASPDGPQPTTLFTDLETFEQVIATTPKAGSDYRTMYASGRRGQIAVGPSSELEFTNSADLADFVDVFDPYSIPQGREQQPCTPTAEDPCPSGPRLPSNPPIYPGTPPRNVDVYDNSATITWPSLSLADVISGVRDGGFSAGSSAPLGGGGHTSIISRLPGGARTGGDILNVGTQAWEAVGYRPLNKSDEVVERPARTYWIDDGAGRDVYVRYDETASTTQRAEAVAYAALQDRDGYSAITPKWLRDQWYCSKLVWGAYKEGMDEDIDWDWGYYVFPEDVQGSRVLRTVYHFVRT